MGRDIKDLRSVPILWCLTSVGIPITKTQWFHHCVIFIVGIHIQLRCRYNAVNFLQNYHNRHPIARPWGRGMGGLLWVWNLIYFLLLQLQCPMYYRDKLDRVIMALHCTLYLERQSLHWNRTQCHYLEVGDSSSPCEGIKVCIWYEIHDTEHTVLETFDDLANAILELLLIWSKQQLVGLHHKLGNVQWRQLRHLILVFLCGGLEIWWDHRDVMTWKCFSWHHHL